MRFLVPDSRASIEQLRQPRHERLVRHVEPQRRDRDAIVGERGNIAAVRWRLRPHAHIGDPVISVAAAVLTLIDLQPLLPVTALGRHGNALDVSGRTIGKVDVDEQSRGIPAASTRRMMSGPKRTAVSQWGGWLLRDL